MLIAVSIKLADVSKDKKHIQMFTSNAMGLKEEGTLLVNEVDRLLAPPKNHMPDPGFCNPSAALPGLGIRATLRSCTAAELSITCREATLGGWHLYPPLLLITLIFWLPFLSHFQSHTEHCTEPCP